MRKGLTALLTAFSVFMTAASPVLAATEQEFHTDTDASVPITASVASSYAVVLPVGTRGLTDEDNDGEYMATIGYDVYGKINTDKVLVLNAGNTNQTATYTKTYLTTNADVVADGLVKNQFTMTGDTTGDSVTGAVAQTAVRFVSAPNTAETDFDRVITTAKAATAPYEVILAVTIRRTDTYNGTLQFHFGLVDH